MKAPGALRQNDIVDFVSTLFDAYLAGPHTQSRQNPRGSAGRHSLGAMTVELVAVQFSRA